MHHVIPYLAYSMEIADYNISIQRHAYSFPILRRLEETDCFTKCEVCDAFDSALVVASIFGCTQFICGEFVIDQ